MTSDDLRYGNDVTLQELLDQTIEERNSLRDKLFQERIVNQELRDKIIELGKINENNH